MYLGGRTLTGLTISSAGETIDSPGNSEDTYSVEYFYQKVLDKLETSRTNYLEENRANYSDQQIRLQEELGPLNDRSYSNWPSRIVYATLYTFAYSKGAQFQSSPEQIRYDETAIRFRGVNGIAVI